MHRVGAVLTAALVGGCSFQSFSSGRDQGLGEGEEESEVSGGTRPGVSGTRGVADGDGGDEEETGTPPMTSGVTLPPAEDGGRLDLGSPPMTTGTEEEEGTPMDCTGVSTFELDVEDAMVVEPMIVGDLEGVGLVAYSHEAAGTISFPIDVMCPGTYFVHAYVLDAWAAIHNADPDSYDLEYPGGTGSWFYGCQTGELEDGWHWLQVKTGVYGEPCDTASELQLVLAEGATTITFTNREGEAYWGGMAAIARIVVTTDEAYVPPS